MLKPIISQVLQHLIAQNSWAKPMLTTHSGKVLQLEITSITAHLIVLEDGTLAVAGETLAADAVIGMSMTTALKMLAKSDAAKNEINITGDHDFATDIGKVLSGLSWDIEADLSRVIGDTAAYESIQFAKKTSGAIKQQVVNTAEMLTEYWQEERPTIAKKVAVETFNQAVDTLRDDVARLDKKIEKLAQYINANNSTTNSSMTSNSTVSSATASNANE